MKRFWLGFWAIFTGSVLAQCSKFDTKSREKAGSGRGTRTEGSIVWETPTLVEVNCQTIVWELSEG
jgi:hypothetical protein